MADDFHAHVCPGVPSGGQLNNFRLGFSNRDVLTRETNRFQRF